jgi:hypothetical protein
MRAIVRGKGATESERYLARLADRTFLKFWSYPRSEPGSQQGSSEDLIILGQVSWTPELVTALEERRQLFNIAREGNFREYTVGGDEFPASRHTGSEKASSAISVAVRRALNKTDDYKILRIK